LSKQVIFLAAASVALSPVTPSYAEEKKDENKLVCKREQQTGTRFAKKVCRTSAEWDVIETLAKRAAAEVVNRPITHTER
jgi:hypothetical protein